MNQHTFMIPEGFSCPWDSHSQDSLGLLSSVFASVLGFAPAVNDLLYSSQQLFISHLGTDTHTRPLGHVRPTTATVLPDNV